MYKITVAQPNLNSYFVLSIALQTSLGLVSSVIRKHKHLIYHIQEKLKVKNFQWLSTFCGKLFTVAAHCSFILQVQKQFLGTTLICD